MTKLNEIDGLFIIIIKVFKFTFMFVVSRMWPVLRVNRRFKNLSWYLRENHSCLQLIKYHVTSIMTKSKNIDGLFKINIYVLKLTFMFLVSRMWPVLRVNRRLKNLSCYSWENHSCLQLIKCHVTSIMSKSNDIDGLFIITIYVFKLTVMLLLVRMWPVSLWMGDLKTFHGIWEKTIHVYNWKDIM